jgi:hypothetical protein
MRRFEFEESPPKPIDFEDFVEELGLVADCEGAWALVGMFWHAPVECCRYLACQPALWEELISRARYADARRWDAGVRLGRGVGL